MMQQNSFLRFFNSLAQDLFESNATDITRYNDIQFSPNEYYLNYITVSGGITLTDNVGLYLVDCNGAVLAELEQFGAQQLLGGVIALQINPNPTVDLLDKEVRVKLDPDTLNPVGQKWYSNPIIYSDYRLSEALRFDFKNTRALDGVPYNILGIYQGARVKMWYERPEVVRNTQEYTTLSGVKVGARDIATLEAKCTADYLSNTAYLSLNHAFRCDTIYVNGVRVTNKPALAWGDSYAVDFNQKKAECRLPLDYTDTRNFNIDQLTGQDSVISVTDPQEVVIELNCTEAQFTDDTRFVFEPDFLLQGYSNSAGYLPQSITLLSLPTNGTLANGGLPWTEGDLPYTFPDLNTILGGLDFYPTGVTNELTLENYLTSFQFLVTDTNGNSTAPVTVNIRLDYQISILTNPFAIDLAMNNATASSSLTGFRILTVEEIFYGFAECNTYDFTSIIVEQGTDKGMVSLGIDDMTPPNLPYEITLVNIESSFLVFWPKGRDLAQPFQSYTTNFKYRIKDTDGNLSDVITFIINFTALSS